MKKLLVALGLAVVLSAALWLPSAAGHEAPISASVTVENVSIQVSPSSVNYGTLSLEDTSRSGTAVSPFFTAINNGNVNEDILVRGADATVTGGPLSILRMTRTCSDRWLGAKRAEIVAYGYPRRARKSFDRRISSASACG